MSSIDPEDNFKDPLAPRAVRNETNVRSSLPSSRSNFDEMPQEALRESRPHPLEYERERSRGIYGVAGLPQGSLFRRSLRSFFLS
jgi:hypothetical protein